MSKVFDYSIEFYTWCKKLISKDYKLFSNNNSKRATAAFQAIITESNMNLLRNEHLRSYFQILEKHILHNKSEKDRPKTNNLLGEYERIMDFWEDENSVKIFITALEFILLKDDLLTSIKQLETDELDRSGLNPLSLTIIFL